MISNDDVMLASFNPFFNSVILQMYPPDNLSGTQDRTPVVCSNDPKMVISHTWDLTGTCAIKMNSIHPSIHLLPLIQGCVAVTAGVVRQYAGSACSVCDIKAKAEAPYWGTFVMALMQGLCTLAAMAAVLCWCFARLPQHACIA